MDKRLLAWDSTIILDALLENEHWPEIEPVYNDALAGKVEIIVSEVSVVEVCRLRKSSGAPIDNEADTIRRFFDHSFFRRIAATSVESELAAEIVRVHNLEACDALIAATAIEHHAEILYSRDGTKKRRNNQPSLLKLDGLLGDPPLAIKPPNAAIYLNAPLYVGANSDAKEPEEQARPEA